MISFKNLGQKGRIGNQLFQLATTIGVARQNSDQFIFPPWKYEQHFNLHDCFGSCTNTLQYNEPTFHYQPVPYQPNLDLNGYFQSPRYWSGHEDLIRTVLTPRLCNQMNQIDATSIHVRRTDYIRFSDSHTVLGMDYYNRAMELCPSKLYYVVSDDLAWCRENFKGDRFIFPNGSEIEDLCTMIKCKNNIIANSSFSYFGAYLNANPTKSIVAPKNWFGPALSGHNTKDLIPADWKQI